MASTKTEKKITFGRTQEARKPWQVVYKNYEGQDYCRMTYSPFTFSSDNAIEEEVRLQCIEYDLAGAIIERW